MNHRVYQIIRAKRAWEGPREPAEAEQEQTIGSKGWYTRGYLPHYDQPGAIQMVTFRLADAMPAARRQEWVALAAIKDERERRTQLEAHLDRGHGECLLHKRECAATVEAVLRRGDQRRYRLAAWVVMPNHVHVLVELWDLPLGKLLQAWKGASANAVNRQLGRHGTLWQPEYWDRYMRDEAHFRKAQHYIEANPIKARLARRPEDWPFSSANPQWRWTGANRYAGAHLLPAGARSLERGHSCPLRHHPQTQADKNVGAPSKEAARPPRGADIGARTFLSARPSPAVPSRQECRRSGGILEVT